MTCSPFTRQHQQGFTLVEMMIALIILAMLGLMAWRGLDGLIRGKEHIEAYNAQQREIQYALTLLDRDCNAMVRAEALTAPPVALGNRNIWWMRTTGLADKPSWQIIGYRSQDDGLYRLISDPFATRDKALEVWQDILKAPDKVSLKTDSQLLSDHIPHQEVSILSDVPGLSTPVKALRFVWQVTANDPSADKPLTRICLAGGV